MAQAVHNDTVPINSSNCDSTTCQCIQRIVKALEFYQSSDGTNVESLLQYFNQYKYLLDDYHHIIHVHLNKPSISQTKQEFEKIHEHIINVIKNCQLDNCKKLQRNNRNREKESMINNDNNDNNLSMEDQNKLHFYIETMDTIHCYFIHSYDVGFRIKAKELSTSSNTNNNEQKSNDNNDSDSDEEYSYKDEQMIELQNILKIRRSKLQQIRGLGRVQHTKFVSEIADDSKLDNNLESKNNDKISINPEPLTRALSEVEIPTDVYSFGRRYYYWDYYKNKDEKEEFGPNQGYNYNYWYIEKKYKNIKDEILNNKIYALDKNGYVVALYKAINNFEASLCKTIIADGINMMNKNCDNKKNNINVDESLCIEYGIKQGSGINLEHIFAVILYCDYDNLSYEFSKTFRKLNKNEKNRAMKARNSEFWCWSKLLRECIECYGTTVHHSNISIYYHGVSYMVFNSFISYFASPTSTTSCIEVAAIFAKENGIILELENEIGSLRHFNCSWLSSYSNEDERLFIGGTAPLKFHSIRLVETQENFRFYLKALTLFNLAINGDFLALEDKKLVTKSDYKIIGKLVKYYFDKETDSKSKLPLYITELFKSFCLSKKEININIDNIFNDYPGFKQLLLNMIEVGVDAKRNRTKKKKKVNYLLNIISICKIFKNCRVIIVDYEDSGSKRNLQSQYFYTLLNLLKEINKMGNKCNLTQLRICNAKYLGGKFTNSFAKYTAFKPDYNENHWRFDVQKQGKQLLIYRFL